MQSHGIPFPALNPSAARKFCSCRVWTCTLFRIFKKCTTPLILLATVRSPPPPPSLPSAPPPSPDRQPLKLFLSLLSCGPSVPDRARAGHREEDPADRDILVLPRPGHRELLHLPGRRRLRRARGQGEAGGRGGLQLCDGHHHALLRPGAGGLQVQVPERPGLGLWRAAFVGKGLPPWGRLRPGLTYAGVKVKRQAILLGGQLGSWRTRSRNFLSIHIIFLFLASWWWWWSEELEKARMFWTSVGCPFFLFLFLFLINCHTDDDAKPWNWWVKIYSMPMLILVARGQRRDDASIFLHFLQGALTPPRCTAVSVETARLSSSNFKLMSILLMESTPLKNFGFFSNILPPCFIIFPN